MRQFFKAFMMIVLLSTPIFSYAEEAEETEFECETNTMLDASSLACVSCALQKHNVSKGLSQKVSHKWLILLGLQAKKEYGYKPAISPADKENYQKTVTRLIQVYGYCSEYLGKETIKNGRTEKYHDMSAEDWRYFNEFINRRQTPNEKSWQETATKLGFKKDFLSGLFTDASAERNKNYFFEGMFSKENLTLEQKRDLYKEKIRETLRPEYDPMGNRREKRADFVAEGDKDQGLRKCLEDVDNRLFKSGLDPIAQDKDTYAVCEKVVNECGIKNKKFDDSDFCLHTGMTVRPAAKVKPVPQSPVPPPPPRPGSAPAPTPTVR